TNRGRLAVHQPRRAHDRSAVCFRDALMPQTNAKDWNSRTKPEHDFFADTGRARHARPRRNTNAGRSERGYLIERNLVVASDDNLRAEIAERLSKIVSERVVVIQEQELCSSLQRSRSAVAPRDWCGNRAHFRD